MTDVASAINSSDGVAFLVSAGLVYEAIAAACSSPQTMEINAEARAGTLMKWVHLGVGQAILFVILAAMWDKRHRQAIIFGGGLAAGLMYWQYVHARDSGLRNGGPGTES